ncbi:MAG: protein kinase [Hyphomicrobiaceae bacterium]
MSDMAALKPGTILVDDYRIERVIGAGGFGITYLAEEVPLARLVTIKEYFPVDFAARDSSEEVVPRSQGSKGDYEWGLDRFLAEAQTLARFNHPNIVRVYRFFQARNTAYIVLHYEDGQSLKGWLRSLGRAPRQHELDKLVDPLLSASRNGPCRRLPSPRHRPRQHHDPPRRSARADRFRFCPR